MQSVASEWIEIARLCSKLHCLPYAGGLLQQPGWVYKRLKAVIIVDDQLQELENAKQKASIQSHGN